MINVNYSSFVIRIFITKITLLIFNLKMQESRNKRQKTNSKSEEEFDYKKDSVDPKDIEIDNINEDKNNFDDDSSEDSNMSDEIDKKISSIYDKNKNFFELNDNKNEENTKNDKKKKVKYDKKIMGNKFNEYFDAYKNQIDDYYEVNYPGLNQYELKIDVYSDLFKLILKKKIFPDLLIGDSEKEKLFIINRDNLFKLMYDLLFFQYNIFLYGFGNKMNLAFDFINLYYEKYYEESNVPLYIISCNLNNSEMNIKVILNKIQGILETEFIKYFEEKYNCSEPTIEGLITKLQYLYNEIKIKYQSTNNLINEEKEEGNKNSESSSSEKEDNDEENNYSEIKMKNRKFTNLKEDNLPFRILLVLNNIGSSVGQSKNFQYYLSDLALHLYFIRLFVTCENLVIPFYWTIEVKDKFRFCFLKYNTFEPYDSEIDENNSIKVGNNIREGSGLKEIFCSFSETQKRLMKEIAILNLKGDHEHLTPKGLVKHFIETGIGIVTDIQKLETLMTEAIDHEIVELKVSNENNKEIYKMNLEKSIIEKIAEGEFM